MEKCLQQNGRFLAVDNYSVDGDQSLSTKKGITHCNLSSPAERCPSQRDGSSPVGKLVANKKEPSLSELNSAWLDEIGVIAGHLTSSALAPWHRNMFSSLITLKVHARDVLQSLIANKVTCITDFQWQRWALFLVFFFCQFCGCAPRIQSTTSYWPHSCAALSNKEKER